MLHGVSCTESDATVLCKYNTPALKVIDVGSLCKHADELFPAVFKPSSLSIFSKFDDTRAIESHKVNLLRDNLNIKYLVIKSDTYLISLAPALCDNTSESLPYHKMLWLK